MRAMPPEVTRAAVMTGRRAIEVQELPIPALDPAAGLLKVEATGVCGADVGFYGRDLSPRVLGHEVVGEIAALGSIAAQRWGVGPGDRVVLEEYLPCGHCSFCRSSDFRACLASDPSVTPGALRYGSTPLIVDPGLWGGYSEYMYLHPNTVVHRIQPDLPAVLATLALPLGNGYQWAYEDGGTAPGSTVVVMGPGQQGLGCVIAAREAGAHQIIVTGLARDGARLEAAQALGAHHVLVDDGDVLDAVTKITDGAMADLVIDTAAGNETTVPLALDLVRKRGTLVFPASVRRPLPEVDFFKITRKGLTVRGVRGHSFGAVDWAIDLISSKRYPLELMCSLEVGLDGVERAILGTGGELDVPVIHAAVVPFER